MKIKRFDSRLGRSLGKKGAARDANEEANVGLAAEHPSSKQGRVFLSAFTETYQNSTDM